jgi:integrase
MLQAGIPVKVVSERLGHANATITLNLYAHVLPNMQRAAADMLGLVLAGRGPLAPDLHQLANS